MDCRKESKPTCGASVKITSKLEDGILYYKRVVANCESKELWRICMRREEDKRRVIESCHAGVEGKFR